MKRILAVMLLLAVLMSASCTKERSLDENAVVSDKNAQGEADIQPDATEKEPPADSEKQPEDKAAASVTENDRDKAGDNVEDEKVSAREPETEQKPSDGALENDQNTSDTTSDDKTETTAPEQNEQEENQALVYDDSNATPASSFIYKIFPEDNMVCIFGFKGTEKDVVIPNYIEGYPVTNIADFMTSTVETLVIPENVNVMSPDAVVAENIKTITVKSKKLDIWHWAFQDCSSLEKITFYDGEIIIRGKIFNNCCKLKEVIFLGKAPECEDPDFLIKDIIIEKHIMIKHRKDAPGWDAPKWTSSVDVKEWVQITD